MAFPKTVDALREAGYLPDGYSTCSCGAKMHWYLTPAKKRMPMIVDGEGNVHSHFSDCPDAAKYRKGKR